MPCSLKFRHHSPWASFLLLAGTAGAQLDFGSPRVSGENIDAYATPFYKLMATPLGSNRLLPDATGPAYEIGLETAVTPLPDGEPFQNAERSLWPVFRITGGARLGRFALGARGMGWQDPSMGLTYMGGGNVSGTLPLAKSRWAAMLQGGWDHLHFSSAYDFHYPGSIFSEGETVPGDYTLREDAWGATAGIVYRPSRLKLHMRSGPETTLARLRYLYYPSGEARQEAHSSKRLNGWRTEAGAEWRGFRLEAGYYFSPYLNAGWTWGWG